MKKTIYLLCLLPLFTHGQNITTVAGNGSYGYNGDGIAATTAKLYNPSSVAADNAGNIYIADYQNYRVRKVSTTGIITTIAGTGVDGYSGDGGPATNAMIHYPAGIAIDNAGNLYIADGTSSVRKVTASGTITRFAGNGSYGSGGDGGPATSASLAHPIGLAIDNAGNVYIADHGNVMVRKVNTAGTITAVTQLGGCGSSGATGDGGPATAAKLCSPEAVGTDNAGNIYICDYLANNVRIINSSGIISTFAGNGSATFAGDGGPATAAAIYGPRSVVADNAGNVYIGDYQNFRVRKVNAAGIISTFAGGGTSGLGDGGPATAGQINSAAGLALDNAGNLLIADNSNSAIRRVGPGGGLATTNAALTSTPIIFYPNPANDQLTIVSVGEPIKSLCLINATGKVVFTRQYTTTQIEISLAQFPAGLYAIKVNSLEYRKFVKE